jgi:DNA-binding GntR family transcriptional regulator
VDGVNRESPDWPKVQVAARLREQIKAGELGPKLPSHMVLAEQLGVATMTVQRALQILRDEGLIYSVPGLGTFVTAGSPGQ